jgi:hypothetical protein
VPYRRVHLINGDKTEVLWSRVSDQATVTWLSERARLRARGYPDRPPDCDLPTIRVWVEHDGEAMLPYFRERAAEAALEGAFPTYVVAWHAPDDSGVKLIVTGLADGSLISRVVLEDPSGKRTVDKAHRYPPEDDPNDVWDAVVRVIGFVNEAGYWDGEPLITDYLEFVALDAELEAARADAIAAGLMTERKLDA